MTIPDLSGLTTAELEAVRDQATELLAVAYAAETAEERAAQEQERHVSRLNTIAESWHAAHGGVGTQDNPVPYRPVTGAHDVWPADSWVICDGAVWYNPHPANSWEPGDVGSPWVRQDDPDPDTGHIAWAVGQDVKVGDERTHDGRLWRARLAHTTHAGWAPSAHTHAVWTDIGAAPTTHTGRQP